MTTLETARATFYALCSDLGTTPVAEENAILSVGREFLPPCAIAVLNDRDAATVEYFEWLSAETQTAQDEHDREIDAGHEWHREEYPICKIHDADDVVPGRICGRPLPCRDHG